MGQVRGHFINSKGEWELSPEPEPTRDAAGGRKQMSKRAFERMSAVERAEMERSGDGVDVVDGEC